MKSSKKLRISSHLLFVYVDNQDRKWRMLVLVFSSAPDRVAFQRGNNFPVILDNFPQRFWYSVYTIFTSTVCGAIVWALQKPEWTKQQVKKKKNEIK